MFYYRNREIGRTLEEAKKYILSDRALVRGLADAYLFNAFDVDDLIDWVVDAVVDEGGFTDECIVDMALSYMEDMWDPKEGRMTVGYFGYDDKGEERMTTYRFRYELVVDAYDKAEARWKVSEMSNDEFRESIDLVHVEEVEEDE